MTTSTVQRAGSPLSFGQEQLWFLDQLSPGATTYQIMLASRLRGPLDLDVLRRSLALVIGRHEAMRVSIGVVDGTPCQVVAPPSDVRLDVLDRTGTAPAAQAGAVDDEIERLSRLPFDLEHGPLYRYAVVRLAADDHVLLQNLHHIITDGWSSGLVNADLAVAYRALLRGREPVFATPPSHYTRFARAQRDQLAGAGLEEELTYWAQRLAGLPTLELPADRARPPAPGRHGASVNVALPGELLVRARALAAHYGVSLFMVLAAGLNVVLSRYSGQDDIGIGVPMLGRVEPELEEVVGLFVNMCVLRTDLSGDPSFATLLARVLENNLDLYEHQEVPFHLIVDRVQPVRTPGMNPLFQVSMQVLGAANSGGGIDLPGIESRPIPLASSGSRFDLAIDFVESGDEWSVSVEYATELFDRWRIEALVGHVATVVAAAADDPSVRVSRLPLLSTAERGELLSLGAGEPADYPAVPLHAGLAEVARRTPDATAVVCNGVELGYAALDRQGNRLARHLRSLGVRHGQIVAVVIDRDLDAYVAMVGVLKAGAAFAMMDPKTPTARLDYMIRDTGAPVVITRSSLESVLPAPAGWVTVRTDAGWETVDDSPVEEWTTPESLAYVLYTSGSTGSPKGVLVAHRAVSFFCESYVRQFDLGPRDRLLQLPALNFDMSQGEIWTAWQVGATLVAVSPEDAQSPEALSALLREQRVTYAGLPPAMQSVMEAEPYPDLRYVMGGAEVLPPDLVNKWNLPGRRYLNLYGPTECAIGQTSYEVEHRVWTAPPPIGRPQLNRQVYVVDRHDQLVPKGVNGELLIGGRPGGLARGYLNQPGLTAEKFVTDPFDPDSTVYRSGDLVRWNADGQIEFLGRLDNQVKLRGLRIELGEIETALQSHPAVVRAVVLMRPDRRGENRLVAWFVAAGPAPQVDQLRRYLAASLPEYMVPTAWVPLARFPMNNDGWKINRNALPDPAEDEGGPQDEAPGTATEERVGRCFAEVLAVDRVGVRDSFFDVGGNSLQALRAVSRINKAFGIRISVRLLYGNATVSAVAAVVDDLIEAQSRA